MAEGRAIPGGGADPGPGESGPGGHPPAVRDAGVWNGPRRAFEGQETLHGLIREACRGRPGAVAVVFDGPDGRQVVTFGELQARAGRLAHELRARGVGRDVPVGVRLERSPERVVALLAILEAGGAYLALDPTYPPERVALMVEDSGAPLVLGDDAGADVVVEGRAAEWLRMREVEEAAEERWPAAPPPGEVSGRDLAYVLYTSGSTGRPKGVMVEHRSIVNRLRWSDQAFPTGGAPPTVLQKTPFGFDVSVWEIFWPLARGGRLVLARPGGHRDPGYLARAIEREEIAVVNFVPPMLRLFLDQEGLEKRCRSLRHVLVGGEAVDYGLTRRFYERMPEGARLYNAYGPTEATVDVSFWPVPREGWEDEIVPIGRPVANTRLLVLDDEMEPAGVGVPGELHVGGVQVARGYLNRPELTERRFVPDPFGPDPGARLYRTGDRARWRSDGTLEFLGRLDRQVKLRGQRVELGEVEAALRALRGVREAAVVLEQGPDGADRLVGYVVGDADPESLRAHLATILPEAWIPSFFVGLDAMPLTASGKLDRGELPGVGEGRPARGKGALPGGIESALATIWEELLDLQGVGPTDDLFQVGGHSLTAVRLVSRIRDRWGVELPLAELVEEPTLRAMAERVERELERDAAAPGGTRSRSHTTTVDGGELVL